MTILARQRSYSIIFFIFGCHLNLDCLFGRSANASTAAPKHTDRHGQNDRCGNSCNNHKNEELITNSFLENASQVKVWVCKAPNALFFVNFGILEVLHGRIFVFLHPQFPKGIVLALDRHSKVWDQPGLLEYIEYILFFQVSPTNECSHLIDENLHQAQLVKHSVDVVELAG